MEVTDYTPADLLETARELLSRTDTKAKGIWPRAAALLCRQALETSLERFWKTRLPGMESVTMRAQLTCLVTYMDDAELAGRAAYTWTALSQACHHHTYEIAPTDAELRTWMQVVACLEGALKPLRSDP